MIAYSIEQLRKMSDQELIREHDRIANQTEVGLQYFLDELRRRENERTNEQMRVLSEAVSKMTWRIELLTWVAVLSSIVGLIAALLN